LNLSLPSRHSCSVSTAQHASHTLYPPCFIPCCSPPAAARCLVHILQPINLIFRFLQSKQRILVWLYEQPDTRIEGRIIGFDEYMNLVLDDAEEVSVKRKTRKALGRILLKGDNITLMQTVGRQ
jgi:small nuclear ribonucleoprotein E